jgi:hypothetical protein
MAGGEDDIADCEVTELILGMKKTCWMVRMSRMAYSEVNQDMILGAEKMVGGRNAIPYILKLIASFDFWHGKA